MTNEDNMLYGASVERSDGQLRVPVRLPWYRSLPISAVVGLEVAVNGERISSDRIALDFHGSIRRIEDLEPCWDEMWFIQDRATVVVTDPPATPGEEVVISATVTLRSPYIMIGPATPLVTTATAERWLPIDRIGVTR